MTDIKVIKARMKQLDETYSAAQRASGDLRDVLKSQTLEIASEIHGDAIASIRALLEQREADQARIKALEAALREIAALGEMKHIPSEGCTAIGREEAAAFARRALED